MRIYRRSYSKTLPDDAKILRRKDGRYAKFRNGRGKLIEAKLTKSGDRILVETQTWSVAFKDHSEVPWQVKGFTDKAATERMATTIQDLLSAKGSGAGIEPELRKRLENLPGRVRQDLAGWGIIDTKAITAMQPLSDLITFFGEHLRAKERAKYYVSGTIADLKALCDAGDLTYFSDIDASRIEAYLKARRDSGISYRRSNAILRGLKMLCNWLVRERVVSESPVKHLKPLNVKEDRRRLRRALEVGDVRRLLAVTSQSGTHHGLTGYERSLLYRLAIESGLRKGELAKLKVGAFDWDTLTIKLEAKDEKNRQGSTLPIRPDTAAELQKYLRGKLLAARAFAVPGDASGMLREDLKTANIPYTDDQGRVYDFHSLRVQCATLLAQAGVHPRTAQQIMRHGDVNLTMATYSFVLRGQESRAVDSLPDLSIDAAQEQSRRTGTDDRDVTPKDVSKSCFEGGQMRMDADGCARPAAPRPRSEADIKGVGQTHSLN